MSCYFLCVCVFYHSPVARSRVPQIHLVFISIVCSRGFQPSCSSIGGRRFINAIKGRNGCSNINFISFFLLHLCCLDTQIFFLFLLFICCFCCFYCCCLSSSSVSSISVVSSCSDSGSLSVGSS